MLQSDETGQPVPTAMKLPPISVRSSRFVHSAFEYYGYANQVFYDVYIHKPESLS